MPVDPRAHICQVDTAPLLRIKPPGSMEALPGINCFWSARSPHCNEGAHTQTLKKTAMEFATARLKDECVSHLNLESYFSKLK